MDCPWDAWKVDMIWGFWGGCEGGGGGAIVAMVFRDHYVEGFKNKRACNDFWPQKCKESCSTS